MRERLWVRCFAPGLGLFACSGLSNATTPSVAEMVTLRTIEEQRLSPDGRYVAYVEREIAGAGGKRARRIRLVEPGSSRAQRELSADFSRSFEPRWRMSRSGKAQLAFLAEGSTHALPGERSRELWLLTPGTGETKRVADKLRGAAQLDWVPRSDFISFIRQEETASPRLVSRVAGSAPPSARLWVINTDDGRTSPLSPEGYSVNRYAWSSDGATAAIAAVPHDAPNASEQIFLLGREGGSLRLLMSAHDDTISLAWAPDGRSVAWLGREHEPGSGQIVISSTVGQPAPRTVLADFPGSAAWLGYRPDGRLVMAALRGVRMGVFSFRDDGSDLRTEYDPQRWAPGSLCGEELSRFMLSFSEDGSRVSTTVSGPNEPGNIVLGRWRKALDRVTDLNPQVRAWSMGTLESVHWQAEDGLELEGLLLKPPHWQPGKRYPTLVHPHGGPRRSWWSGWLFNASAWGQFFASRGYLVFLPNVRGSEGYGAEFVRANRADLGGKDLQDILSGVDALIDEGLADPDRLAIAGWSYGGYMTARAITTTGRFKAAIVGAGVSNLLSFEGAGGSPQWSRTFWRDPLTPYRNPQALLDRSPLFHVARVTTPTLLFHGTEDTKVPLAQMIEFHTALRALGVATEAVEYPGADHGLTDAAQVQDMYGRMDAWLQRYVPVE